MEITIDIESLRSDLEDYFSTGAFNGTAEMMIEVQEIQQMTDDEVVRKAQSAGFDLLKYQI